MIITEHLPARTVYVLDEDGATVSRLLPASTIEHDVQCHCNAGDCVECTDRVRRGASDSFHSTLTHDQAVMLDAVLDGRSFDDPSKPMTKADFALAMQTLRDHLVAKDDRAATKLIDQNAPGLAKAHEELLQAHAELHSRVADLEHENAMQAKLLDVVTAPADPERHE